MIRPSQDERIPAILAFEEQSFPQSSAQLGHAKHVNANPFGLRFGLESLEH
jgi:hypothetical protein